MNRALNRILDGRLGRMGEALLSRLVPSSTARAGFYWKKVCESSCGGCLKVSCPANGVGDRPCWEMLCEIHSGGTVTCYPNTTRNHTCECC